jgi:hypothetical protein
MTRDDVIRMAQEAKLRLNYDAQVSAIERFAALVAAAECEACAKVCEMTYEGAFEGARPCFETPDQCADAIRARN